MADPFSWRVFGNTFRTLQGRLSTDFHACLCSAPATLAIQGRSSFLGCTAELHLHKKQAMAPGATLSTTKSSYSPFCKGVWRDTQAGAAFLKNKKRVGERENAWLCV
jgi:hypothetical protein